MGVAQLSTSITIETPNRREQLLLDVAEPVTLIEKTQIEDTGARSAKDILVEQNGSGIQVNAGGGQGYVSINGIPNKVVLVLVNGRRYLGKDANGNLNLEELRLPNIERIEVVKGAGSALYGSDVPQARVSQIDYIIYVDPQAYYQLDSLEKHAEVARCIGHLNHSLEGGNFILIGPGRWGSSDSMQGVPVTYADIFNACALVEVASHQGGFAAEPSYGTHFFQDLVESQIYPLAVYPDEPGDSLNLDFIENAENQMAKFIPEATKASLCI